MNAPVQNREVNIEVAEVFLPLLVPSRYKGAHGGRGSGKSHFFADLMVEKAAWHPVRCVCLREFQRSLTYSVKALLESKIQKQGVSDRFRILKTHIEGASGSLIIFEGMQSHNADSIKSLEDFDIGWFEEAHRASDHSMEILRPTIRKPDSELWFSWNRNEPTDPVEQLFYGGEAPPDSVVVEANWRDNPWLPDVLYEEMKYDRRRDPDKYTHVWQGGFKKASEARVFRNWFVDEFEIEALKEAGEDISGPYYGADWGYAQDPTVLVRVWVDDTKKRIYIDYEAFEVGCKLQHHAALFDRVPGSRHHQIKADSARPETIDLMRDEGFEVVPAKKGSGSVEDGIEFLKSYDIVVNQRCRHTQDELTHYSYKVDKLTGKPTNELADKENHVIDSIRYATEDIRRAGHDFL